MVQVQGSARVRLPTTASVMRLVYAGRNGQPYTSIGSIIVERAHGPGDDDPGAADGLAAETSRTRPGPLMRLNRSYIFFRRRPRGSRPDGRADRRRRRSADPGPLPRGRPLAVGLRPAVLARGRPARDRGGREPLRRLMIAQDTGIRHPRPGAGRLLLRLRRGGRNPGRASCAIRSGSWSLRPKPPGDEPHADAPAR